MSEKKANGEITIPTLNIEEAIEPLCTKLLELNRNAEALNIFNPFGTSRSLRRVSRQRDSLRSRYHEETRKCHDCLRQPVSAPGALIGSAQAWSTAKGTSAILRLQNSWSELGALLDRKYAYSFAVVSLYVAILSLLLTVVFGMTAI